MEDSTSEVAELLMHASRRIRQHTARELAPLGLTPGQSRTLRILLLPAPGPMRMVDIAHRLDVVPRAATSLVDALEERGLVERVLDPRDRRAVLVRLTRQGRDLRHRFDNARARGARSVLGALSDADQQHLLRLLTAVCEHCCGEHR